MLRFVKLLAWSEIQKGLPVENETPHGSFRVGVGELCRALHVRDKVRLEIEVIAGAGEHQPCLQGFDPRAGAPHLRTCTPAAGGDHPLSDVRHSEAVHGNSFVGERLLIGSMLLVAIARTSQTDGAEIPGVKAVLLSTGSRTSPCLYNQGLA